MTCWRCLIWQSTFVIFYIWQKIRKAIKGQETNSIIYSVFAGVCYGVVFSLVVKYNWSLLMTHIMLSFSCYMLFYPANFRKHTNKPHDEWCILFISWNKNVVFVEKNHNRMLHSLALIAKDQEHSLRDFIRDTKAGSRAQYHKFWS